MADPARTMAELLAQTGTIIKNFTRGDIIEGTVVSRRRNEILLEVGAKSEGIIDPSEVEEDPALYHEIKVGDKITAAVVYPENDQGYLVLSLSRAAAQSKWRTFEEALDSGRLFDVEVVRDFGLCTHFPPATLSFRKRRESRGPHRSHSLC